MFNVKLYDVDVEIKIYREEVLVAKAKQPRTAWMSIKVDNTTELFDLMGVSQMYLDYKDDDYIVFKKSTDSDLVVVTVSKHGVAQMIGEMIDHLAGTMLSLDRDEY